MRKDIQTTLNKAGRSSHEGAWRQQFINAVEHNYYTYSLRASQYGCDNPLLINNIAYEVFDMMYSSWLTVSYIAAVPTIFPNSLCTLSCRTTALRASALHATRERYFLYRGTAVQKNPPRGGKALGGTLLWVL